MILMDGIEFRDFCIIIALSGYDNYRDNKN